MTRTHVLVAFALTLPLTAGCLAGTDSILDPASADAGSESESRSPIEWPPLDSATVRPGVQVRSESGQCTSNFVFVDNQDASLYLGLAAHCVDDLALGAAVDIANGAASGTVHYDARDTMGRTTEYLVAGAATDFSCTNASSDAACSYNDFALIRIDEAYHPLVHPAVLHFGGPVALADSAGVAVHDRVLTYGHSMLRQGVDPANRHEGVVTAKPDAWSTRVHTFTPGVPGDSGSGAMTGSGEALGIVVTLGADGGNGVTSLDLALAYAKEHAGVDVSLATWDLLDDGVLSPP